MQTASYIAGASESYISILNNARAVEKQEKTFHNTSEGSENSIFANGTRSGASVACIGASTINLYATPPLATASACCGNGAA